MRYLIVVDMQNDFVTGSLGSKMAETIVPAVCEKIRSYKAQGSTVFMTLDTHFKDYLETPEGKKLPVELRLSVEAQRSMKKAHSARLSLHSTLLK